MSHILVIDDEPSVRETLELCLKHAGHEVFLAADGMTGLQVAAEHAIDLVLCDIHMPVMTGIATCKAFKDSPTLCHLPFVMMCGALTKVLGDRARDAGASEILSKPFSLHDLEAAFSRCVPAT